MAWQLIFTSSPRGLALGRSGFCTVARDREMKESLVAEVERLSTYHHISSSNPLPNPVIASYRILEMRDETFHILSRISDCGFDYTSRTNHIAHHLVFSTNEISSLPSPAHILSSWSGWRSKWSEDPRYLENRDAFDPHSLSNAPENSSWKKLTGDAKYATLLVDNIHRNGCFLLTEPGNELSLLHLIDESLRTFGKLNTDAWKFTFTTFLQPTDSQNDFQWKGSWEQSPTYQNALTSSPLTLDLTKPDSLPLPDKISAPIQQPRNSKKDPAISQAKQEPENASQDIPKLSPRSFQVNPAKEIIHPFPSTQPTLPPQSRKNPWKIIATASVLLGILMAGIVAKISFSKPESPTTRPFATKEDITFPSQLPSTQQPPHTQADLSTNAAPAPVATKVESTPPPSTTETPPPQTEESFDGIDPSSGLPKRKSFVFLGTLNGGGIAFSSSEDSYELKRSLQKLEKARFWRVPNGLTANTADAEKLEQRIPGTSEIKLGIFYNTSAKQVFSLTLTSEASSLRSPESEQGILVTSPTKPSDALQIVCLTKNQLNQKPLIRVPLDRLELKTDNDSTTLSIKKEFWNDFSTKIHFPQFGNTLPGRWALNAGSPPSPASSANETLPPSISFGSSKAKSDLLKSKQEHENALASLEKQIAEQSPKLKAYNLLFSKESPFFNLGYQISGLTPDAIQKEIARIQIDLEQTSTGRENRRQKGLLANQLEQMESTKKILTFDSYLSSLSPQVRLEKATPKHYAEYMIVVLKAVEPQRGYCIGTDGTGPTAADEILSFRWNDIPRLFSKSVAQDDYRKKVSEITNTWNQIFTPDALATLSPLLEKAKTDLSGKFLDDLSKLNNSRAVHSQALAQIDATLKQSPTSLDEIPFVTLEWISGTDRYSIITFQNTTQ